MISTEAFFDELEKIALSEELLERARAKAKVERGLAEAKLERNPFGKVVGSGSTPLEAVADSSRFEKWEQAKDLQSKAQKRARQESRFEKALSDKAKPTPKAPSVPSSAPRPSPRPSPSPSVRPKITAARRGMSRGAKAGLVGAGILGVGALGYGLKKLRDREKTAEEKKKKLKWTGRGALAGGLMGAGVGGATGAALAPVIQSSRKGFGSFMGGIGALGGAVAGGLAGGAVDAGRAVKRGKEKTAESDDQITKDKLKRFLRYGGAGAAGMGLGYATGKLVGRPIQKKLIRWGSGPKAAKLVRYGVPTSAGLGAALMVSKKLMDEKLTQKIRGDDNS